MTTSSALPPVPIKNAPAKTRTAVAVKSAATPKPALSKATAKVSPAKPVAQASKKSAVAQPKTATTKTGAAVQIGAETSKGKAKLVRDSFTMPKLEYVVLDALKRRAAALAQPVKKSELLRAAIKSLSAMPDKAFLVSLKAVPTIKTGRPGKA